MAKAHARRKEKTHDKKRRAWGWVEFTRTALWTGKLLHSILIESSLRRIAAMFCGLQLRLEDKYARTEAQVWNMNVLYRFVGSCTPTYSLIFESLLF